MKERHDFHFSILIFWMLKSQKHIKFHYGDLCVRREVSSTPFSPRWELVHLDGAFCTFNGTEMLGDHRLLGFYSNSNFYFLSRWKTDFFIVSEWESSGLLQFTYLFSCLLDSSSTFPTFKIYFFVWKELGGDSCPKPLGEEKVRESLRCNGSFKEGVAALVLSQTV